MLARHINKDSKTFSDVGLSFVDVSGNDLYTLLYPSNTAFQAQMTTFPRFTATIYNAVFNNGIALPGTFDTPDFWEFLENMVRLHILKGVLHPANSLRMSMIHMLLTKLILSPVKKYIAKSE